MRSSIRSAAPHSSAIRALEWAELEAGATPLDFTIASVPARVREVRDPWSARAMTRARVDLRRWRDSMIGAARARAS